MAIDMNLVADIRSGAVVRHTLMTVSNEQATIRTWSGRGELTVDGVKYGGTGDDMIAVSGISDTSTLQSHEVEIAISLGAARKLGVDGFATRGASVEIVTIFLAGDGSIRPLRKVTFKGSIQSAGASISHDTAAVTYRARPPLLDLSRDRMTRYTPADQYRRFGSSDTGFDDVRSLANKEPVDWSPSGSGVSGDIHIQWSISAGLVSLVDTSGRPVSLVGGQSTFTTEETAGGDDALLLQASEKISGITYQGKRSVVCNMGTFSAGGVHGVDLSIQNGPRRYLQIGASVDTFSFSPNAYTSDGTTQYRVTGSPENFYEVLLRFSPAVLDPDGFLKVGGQNVVVDQSSSKIYTSDGYILHVSDMRFVDHDDAAFFQIVNPRQNSAIEMHDLPDVANPCPDIIDNLVRTSVDLDAYLEAQIV